MVEDDPASLTVVTAMLETLEVVPVAVETGEQALALLEARRFDAVLIDVHLPLLDGHDVARRWREREAHSRAARLPIVAMTGNATDEDARRCIASGMDAVLVKPFGIADLRERIAAAAEDR